MSHRFQSRISEPHNSNYSPTSKNRENIDTHLFGEHLTFALAGVGGLSVHPKN